jgi:hypothetical protein
MQLLQHLGKTFAPSLLPIVYWVFYHCILHLFTLSMKKLVQGASRYSATPIILKHTK